MTLFDIPIDYRVPKVITKGIKAWLEIHRQTFGQTSKHEKLFRRLKILFFFFHKKIIQKENFERKEKKSWKILVVMF
jgi:hypothetical protein